MTLDTGKGQCGSQVVMLSPDQAECVRCAMMIGRPLVPSVDVEESRPGFPPDKVNFDRKEVLGIFYPHTKTCQDHLEGF